MTTAPATTGTAGQESAAATAASTGRRASCACRADTAPAAGVRSHFLSMLLPVSHLDCFVSDGLSKPRNASPFQHQHFSPSASSHRGMAQGLRREEEKVGRWQRLT